MKTKNLCCLCFFMCFLLYGRNHSDTLSIAIKPTGNHYQTLQNALNNTTKLPLKIIVNGNFKINQILTTTRPNTTIDFAKNASITLLDEAKGGIILKNDNCIIKNGTFIGNGKSTKIFYDGYGILLYGVNNCVVKNMTFRQISGINIFLTWNGVKGCQNNQILKNKFSEPVMNIDKTGDDAAILLGYSGKGYSHDNNLIKDNIIDGNNVLKIGMGIIGHGNNNVFENNTISNLRNYGIIAYESEDTDVTLNFTKILNNKIQNVGEIGQTKTVKGMGIYLMKSNKSLVEGNQVYNTLRNSDETETLGAGSISVGMSPESKINKNQIDGSFMYGIVCSYAFNSEITNNKITNTRKSGIYIINSNDLIIKNNTLEKIGEVVFKGYFEDTSLPYIINMWKTKKYINQPTGNNITIDDNVIFSSNQILYFTGTPSKNNYKGNKIKNNAFRNNKIWGNKEKAENLIFFREDDSKTNKIFNNSVK